MCRPRSLHDHLLLPRMLLRLPLVTCHSSWVYTHFPSHTNLDTTVTSQLWFFPHGVQSPAYPPCFKMSHYLFPLCRLIFTSPKKPETIYLQPSLNCVSSPRLISITRTAEFIPLFILFARPVPRNEYPAPVPVLLRGRCHYLSGTGDAMPSSIRKEGSWAHKGRVREIK